jgi:hypothetical protein
MADPLPLRERHTLPAVIAHVWMASDPFELSPPTAEDILRWVETTREMSGGKPTRGAVRAHVEALRDGGLISAEDLRHLRDVPAVAPTASAIRKALEDAGEFGTVPWVACRAGVVQSHVVRARSESPG